MQEKIDASGKNFRNIKSALERNKTLVSNIKENEEGWVFLDSPLFEIGNTFARTLPEKYVGELDRKVGVSVEEYGKAFKSYIENTLDRGSSGGLSAVEFGGSGSKLFSGFSDDFLRRTAGVCLKDIRHREAIQEDEKNNHSVIEGDIFEKSTYSKLEEKTGVKKFDLIISRMMAPALAVDKHPAIMQKIIRKWYKMLSKNGLIFVQFDLLDEHKPETKYRDLAKEKPAALRLSEVFVMDWKVVLEKELKNTVDMQMGRGVIRIHKKAGAPEELPVLANTVNFSLE